MKKKESQFKSGASGAGGGGGGYGRGICGCGDRGGGLYDLGADMGIKHKGC